MSPFREILNLPWGTTRKKNCVKTFRKFIEHVGLSSHSCVWSAELIMSAAVLACKWGLAGAALGAACALLMLSERRAGRKRLMFRTKVSASPRAPFRVAVGAF